MKHFQKTLQALLSFILMAGCTDNIEKLKLSNEDRERILLLQNPFGENLVRLNKAGKGEPILIGLKDCKVYRAEPEQGVVTEWVHVQEVAEFYPLPSACNRESVEYDGEYVRIEFCKTPMGAGGGCAGGISPHRSRNGKDWEVRTEKGKWKLIDKLP
ncbi:hypothetical protein [Variovorax sp. PAMC 28711]|uniref:hypothetical protein n=1 Tax=Variovorax sp. PAMC 28711 TaxID=1795631 RepID=UPI0012E83AE3|nr:hypothetical protein [Variovorax sp. PAMC 28711]